MEVSELTFVTEDKDKPIKIVYENDLKIAHIDDYTFEISGKIYGIKAERIISNMFGTTELAMLDCSDMTDEEIDRIVNELNSIPN